MPGSAIVSFLPCCAAAGTEPSASAQAIPSAAASVLRLLII
jgi:hypothetical protein